MAEIIITATAPTVLPAVAERVYDRWSLLEMRIVTTNDDPNQPVVAIARLCKSRKLDDGTVELSPSDQPVILRIDDVLAAASVDVNIATAMGAIVGAVVDYGQQLGAL